MDPFEHHLSKFTVVVNRELQEAGLSKPEHIMLVNDACVRMAKVILIDLLTKCPPHQWEHQMRLWLEDVAGFHNYVLAKTQELGEVDSPASN